MLPLSCDSSGLRRAHTCLSLSKQLAGKRRVPHPTPPAGGPLLLTHLVRDCRAQGLSVPSEQGPWAENETREARERQRRTDCSRHGFRLTPRSLHGEQRGESHICTGQQVPAACPLGPPRSRQGQRVWEGGSLCSLCLLVPLSPPQT